MRFVGLRMVKKLENNREKKYIFDYIIDDIKNNCLKNTFVFNEGGIGKTTQLKKLAKMLLSSEGRKYASNVIPIYIAVKDLNGSKNKNTLFNAIKKFCGEDSSDKELENLLDGSSSMRKDFVFLFIIDGLNEAKDEIKRELQKEINNLMKFKQNIFIVSSRIDETNYFSGFDKKFFVKPLGNVCEILKVQENEINPKLLEILSIPLYLKYYLYTYKKDTFYFYEDKSVRKSDILKEYLKAIDKNLEKNTVSYDKHTKDFLIDFYLPALAYELEISNEITDEKLSNIKKNIATYEYYEKLLSVDVEDEIATVFKSDCFFPLKIAKEWFALNDKKGYFVHDIWKEYFTASYYSKCIDKDVIDAFDNLQSEGVREFIGEITGECDFEAKDNLETWSESPIEHFMQENYEKLNFHPIAIRNLIEIMKTARNNHITAKYDNLDLQKVKFHGNCNIENSSFCNSRVYINNFPDEICEGVDSACFSPDNKTLAFSTWSKIHLISLFDDSAEIIDREIHNDEKGLYSPGGDMKFSPQGTLLGIHGRNYPNWDLYDIENKRQKESNISDNEDPEELLMNVSSINKDELISLSKDISGVKYNIIAYNESIFSINEKCVLLNGEPFIAEKFNINSIKLTNNGKALITGNSNGEINIYDINLSPISYKLVEKIDNEESITNLAVSNDCRLISAISNYSLRIWEKKNSSYSLLSERKITNLTTDSNGFPTSNRIFYFKGYSDVEDGKIQSAKLQIFNSSTLKTEKIILFNSPISDYCFSDYTEYFAVMLDNRIELWNLYTVDKSIYDISELLRQENSRTLSISFDDNACLSLKNGDSVLRQWKAESVLKCEENKEFYNKYFEYSYTVNAYEIISPIVLGCDFRNSKFDNEFLMLLLHYNGAEIPKKYYSNINQLHRKYENHKRTENDTISIRIPIGKIVNCVEKINDCSFEDDEKLLLRRFMIACLNLGFFEKKRLFDVVNCFGMRIKQIKNERVENLDNYIIKDNILYINKDLMNDSPKKYEICFFKAVAEAIFNPVDVNISISTVITEMAAEKIYNMDINSLRIVFPREEYETICGEKMRISIGYYNYNLLICLAKQLFILKKINENQIIANSFTYGLKNSLYELISDDDSQIYLNALDDEYMFYLNRVESGYEDEKENKLILGYQKRIMNSFTEVNGNYFAFCALITSQVLKNEAINKFGDINTAYDNMLKSLEKNKQVKKLFDILTSSMDYDE